MDAPTAGAPPLRRNSTAFPVKAAAKLRELYERYAAARVDGADPDHGWAVALKYYQFLVRAVMSDPEYGIGADGNARGLLVYHTMGMGKTRLAVAVAMALWDVRPVVVMLAHSLQANFRETVHEVVGLLNAGEPPEVVAQLSAAAVRRFAFVSMDAYNAADQLARVGTGAKTVKRRDLTGATGGLDGKLLIVDEAHNFFRAIINSASERANARRAYDMVMHARNLRLVFLTGTPAAKDPFELVPCFNMLAGHDLLPTQYEIFYKLYVDRAGHKVRNPERLANRLVGLVSHVTPGRPSDFASAAALVPRAAARDDGWFPEQLPTIVERVEMGGDQYRQYLLAREKEEAEGKVSDGAGGRGAGVMTTPALSLPGSEKKAMRSYFVKSRTLSTFCPPREFIGKSVDRMPDEAFTAAAGPKLALVAKRADAAPGPILAYSQFVDAGGLKPLARYLELLGYTPYVPRLAVSAVPPLIDAEDADTVPTAEDADAEPADADAEPAAEDAEPADADADAESAATHGGDATPANPTGAVFTSQAAGWEWAAFELTRKLFTRLVEGLSAKTSRECRNSFERWLLTGANSPEGGIADGPWALHRAALSAGQPTADKFLSELAKAGHPEPRSAVERLIADATAAVGEAVPAPGPMSVWFSSGRIHVQHRGMRHVFKVHSTNIAALLARAAARGLDHEAAVTALTRMLLRYEAALPGGQQLGLPRESYVALYALGVRNEGFASPFNSRMVAMDRPDTTFCSLFPDTDTIFGSLGLFQQVDMAAHPGGWAINPPYVETLMNSAVAKALAELERVEATVFILLPAWDDAAAVKAATGSSRVVATERMRPGECTLEDPEGRQFVAPFGLYYIAISSVPTVDTAAITAALRSHAAARGGATAPKGHYAIISGEVTGEARAAITAAFNSPANAHGAVIKAILVSKTGAEGLDLKWLRETHQIEPYWDRARDDQVMARAVRIGSHDGLPVAEREVQPYLYIATANPEIYEKMLEREPQTIDEQFYERAKERYLTNAAFRTLLTRVCFECELFGYGACRVCIPTNAPLFHDDPALDIRLPDPCEVRLEADVEATPIEFNGVTYYYRADDSEPLGYAFYTYREDLGGYASLDPSDPVVSALLRVLA